MAVILIVDDSPTELHLFQNMLEKNGFRTLVADSGEEGIRQARQTPGLHPDGRRHARHERLPGNTQTDPGPGTSNIPVIMITTKDQETDKIWGMRQGAVEYLVKPVAEKQLVAKINAVVARLNEPGRRSRITGRTAVRSAAGTRAAQPRGPGRQRQRREPVVANG